MKIKTVKSCAAKKSVAKKVTKCAARKAVAAKAVNKAVMFTVHADAGKAVYLAGDFNEWNPTAKKMSFRNGVYATSVKLAPGKHEYKFVIDGTWCADPENVNSVPNDQGTFNSVIDVK